jgi:hypothetical protein
VNKRDFVLLTVYILLMTTAAGGASYFVSNWTGSIAATILAMALVTGIGMFFILRWWNRIARAAGVTKMEWTPSRVTFAIAYASAIILATAVNYANYSFTGRRVSEIAVSFIALFPVLAFLAWKSVRLLDPPKPQEAATLRFSSYSQIALTLLFSLNLAIQLRPEHRDDGSTIPNLVIALYIVLIPLFPINAYYIRKRYLQARDSATPSYRL